MYPHYCMGKILSIAYHALCFFCFGFFTFVCIASSSQMCSARALFSVTCLLGTSVHMRGARADDGLTSASTAYNVLDGYVCVQKSNIVKEVSISSASQTGFTTVCAMLCDSHDDCIGFNTIFDLRLCYLLGDCKQRPRQESEAAGNGAHLQSYKLKTAGKEKNLFSGSGSGSGLRVETRAQTSGACDGNPLQHFGGARPGIRAKAKLVLGLPIMNIASVSECADRCLDFTDGEMGSTYTGQGKSGVAGELAIVAGGQCLSFSYVEPKSKCYLSTAKDVKDTFSSRIFVHYSKMPTCRNTSQDLNGAGNNDADTDTAATDVEGDGEGKAAEGEAGGETVADADADANDEKVLDGGSGDKPRTTSVATPTASTASSLASATSPSTITSTTPPTTPSTTALPTSLTATLLTTSSSRSLSLPSDAIQDEGRDGKGSAGVDGGKTIAGAGTTTTTVTTSFPYGGQATPKDAGGSIDDDAVRVTVNATAVGDALLFSTATPNAVSAATIVGVGFGSFALVVLVAVTVHCAHVRGCVGGGGSSMKYEISRRAAAAAHAECVAAEPERSTSFGTSGTMQNPTRASKCAPRPRDRGQSPPALPHRPSLARGAALSSPRIGVAEPQAPRPLMAATMNGDTYPAMVGRMCTYDTATQFVTQRSCSFTAAAPHVGPIQPASTSPTSSEHYYSQIAELELDDDVQYAIPITPTAPPTPESPYGPNTSINAQYAIAITPTSPAATIPWYSNDSVATPTVPTLSRTLPNAPPQLAVPASNTVRSTSTIIVSKSSAVPPHHHRHRRRQQQQLLQQQQQPIWLDQDYACLESSARPRMVSVLSAAAAAMPTPVAGAGAGVLELLGVGSGEHGGHVGHNVEVAEAEEESLYDYPLDNTEC